MEQEGGALLNISLPTMNLTLPSVALPWGAGAGGEARGRAGGAGAEGGDWCDPSDPSVVVHDGVGCPPPLRTNRTRRVLHPVLIGHAVSLTPY